jgi:hypothetical protein
MKLTKRSIDALKPNEDDAVYWDPELRGFGLRVKPSGSKSFVIQYRNRQGRSRRLTVGQYGRMTPDEARREARRHLSEVERGFDPAEQVLQEKNAITVADLCSEYLAKAEAGLIIGRKGRRRRPARSKSIEAGLPVISSRSSAKSHSRTSPAPT